MPSQEIELKRVSKAYQRLAQFLPPGDERSELKQKMSETRKRYQSLLLLAVGLREIFRMITPLVEQYRELGTEIKNWLDGIEVRSALFIENYQDHNLILENEEAIEVGIFSLQPYFSCQKCAIIKVLNVI